MMQNLNKPGPSGFKNGMRNRVNFLRALKSLKDYTLMDYFCPKQMSVKRFQTIMYHDTEG